MSELFFHDAPEGIAVPAENVRICTEIDGSTVFGRVMLPALDDPNTRTPIVLFLHGFPGTEKNVDIAQLLRMRGIACAYFAYRGVWGSKGFYSFSHLIEDAIAIAAHLRERAEELRIDPDRFYLYGHSMGGFATVNSIAAGLKVKGAFLMAPCDLAERYLYERERFDALAVKEQRGYFTLPSDNSLLDEVAQYAEKWYFPNAAEHMDPAIRYFFIGGTRDTTTPPPQNIYPLCDALIAKGAKVEYLELNESHAFPGSRFAVAEFAAKKIEECEKE